MTDLVLARAGALWRGARGADPAWLLLALIPVALFLADAAGAPAVLGIAAGSFLDTLPFIVVAVGLIALLKATGAEGVIASAFQGREVHMIVLGAAVGGIAPFCSCEVIPFVAALLAAGTPVSAVMAFWLSSPLMDPPQFVITTAALGLEFAVAKVVFAVALGLIGGFGMWAMGRAGLFTDPLKARQAASCGCCGGGGIRAGEPPVWRFWAEAERRSTFHRTALDQTLFLTKWLMLAYLLEGLLISYVPAEAIGTLVGGPGAGPVVLGALVGAPAYLNGYAAPALVSGLMAQGMSAGAAMAFMIAGAVSSIPAMAAVWALVRREVFFAYVAFGLGGAILFGLIFGAVYGLG